MRMHSPLQKVVDGGYCVGCGACAAFDHRIKMVFDSSQRLVASLPEDGGTQLAASACPFAEGNPDENQIADRLFNSEDHQSDSRIGKYLSTWAGWVNEGEFREKGSSGGVGTWLLAELLYKNLVDFVVNVTEKPGDQNGPLFHFSVQSSLQGVLDNAKTRYYPVEMSQVIKYVLNTPGRYAFIGVPCFIKALRLATLADPELAQRVRFTVAIVCGHLKSAAFAESIAWQLGVEPGQLNSIDFRAKLPGRPASRYGVKVSGTHKGDNLEEQQPMEGLLGANWGHGLFKLKACEFCDDVLGETADATVGDAWLPEYDTDHRGSNVIVARSHQLQQLLMDGANSGRLHLQRLPVDLVAASQAGGLRHRREGLAYRLWLTDRAGQWRPVKRVTASRNHLQPHMQEIHRLRYQLGQASHELYQQAKQQGVWQVFVNSITPLMKAYDKQVSPTRMRRIWNRIRRVLSLLKIPT